MKSEKLFKEFNIWKPIDEKKVIRYRCFEILPDRKFFVKASDCIYKESDKKDWDSLESYFLENLFDGIFDELAESASETIEEAIAKHEADFEEVNDEFEELKKFKPK